MEGTRADYIQKYNYPKEVSVFTKIICSSNGRTEISDIDEDATPRVPSPKKNNILLQKKRNIKRKKPENNSEEKNKN